MDSTDPDQTAVARNDPGSRIICLRRGSMLLNNRPITKTCLYNFDPFKPHFYIVKLGFTGIYTIFLISPPTHRLWVFVRTASSRRF